MAWDGTERDGMGWDCEVKWQWLIQARVRVYNYQQPFLVPDEKGFASWTGYGKSRSCTIMLIYLVLIKFCLDAHETGDV